MAGKNIKVKIANREYPLTVDENEEEGILLAARTINENIKKLKGSYVVTDYVDLLAMTALELATDASEGSKVKSTALQNLMDEDIQNIVNKIDEVIPDN